MASAKKSGLAHRHSLSLRPVSQWNCQQVNDLTVWSAGVIQVWPDLFSLVTSDIASICQDLKLILQNQFSCFGLIIESKEGCIAVADQVRSYPIYFAAKENQLFFGEDPDLLIDTTTSPKISDDAVEEYLLSGYVHGGNTLLEEVKQLRAGELFSYSYKENRLLCDRYFRYLPEPKSDLEEDKSLAEWRLDFDRILSSAFRRALDHIGDGPIWIPLSGGMDSRLVLCKCLELGHKNITTFSYGVRDNHEMRMARKIAKQLNVPWRAVPSNLKNLKTFYESDDRKEYARVADGFNAVPSYLDFEAIYKLKTSGALPSDATIINGYSGDFLFGGHIPEALRLKPSMHALVDLLVEKHCSHFLLESLKPAKSRIWQQVFDELSLIVDDVASKAQLCAAYEYWDWQERQVKAVVNAQRAYEHFGIKWMLPFWDKELVDFWSTVPLDLRAEQNLHLSYLQWFDYGGVFRVPRSRNELWPPKLMFMPFVGKLIELFSGLQSKNNFYERTYYFGYFRNQLGLFGYQMYKRYWPSTRRPRVVPIAAVTSLKERGIEHQFPLNTNDNAIQNGNAFPGEVERSSRE